VWFVLLWRNYVIRLTAKLKSNRSVLSVPCVVQKDMQFCLFRLFWICRIPNNSGGGITQCSYPATGRTTRKSGVCPLGGVRPSHTTLNRIEFRVRWRILQDASESAFAFCIWIVLKMMTVMSVYKTLDIQYTHSNVLFEAMLFRLPPSRESTLDIVLSSLFLWDRVAVFTNYCLQFHSGCRTCSVNTNL